MRARNDLYETGRAAVVALTREYPIPQTSKVLEPCAGRGAISEALENSGIWVVTNDKFEGGHDFKLDAKDKHLYGAIRPDLVITNPPFNEAYPILLAALAAPTVRSVILLLRLSFLEPTYERGKFLGENPPSHLIVLPRYSFTGDGKTDSVTCAWMIWERIKNGQSIRVVTKQQIDKYNR
jgi:hypothetical protein